MDSITINGRPLAPRVAPLWRRMLALVIDLFVAGLLTGIPSLAAALFLENVEVSDATVELVSIVVGFLVFAFYQALTPVVSNGRTAGMYVCSIRIADAASLAVPSSDRFAVRGFALAASLLAARFALPLGPFYITGPVVMAALLLPALMRSDRRALHDLIAGTCVVEQRG